MEDVVLGDHEGELSQWRKSGSGNGKITAGFAIWSIRVRGRSTRVRLLGLGEDGLQLREVKKVFR